MKAMVHKANGKCKQGQPRIKWKEQVKGNIRRKMQQIEVGGEKV